MCAVSLRSWQRLSDLRRATRLALYEGVMALRAQGGTMKGIARELSSDHRTVRKFITARGLLDKIRFRNIAYPEVKADFDARGGRSLPALWDGGAFTYGAEEIIARLQSE